MEDSEKYVILGEISGIYGVKGWVKIYSHTKPVENITQYNPWILRIGKTWQARTIVEAKRHGKGVIAHIEGCDDREKARELIGTQIAVSRDDLPETAPDEYYWTDLEGLEVQSTEGVDFGKVDHLFATGANDVMVVKGDRERLIPFLQGPVIKDIDLENRRILVDWPAEF